MRDQAQGSSAGFVLRPQCSIVDSLPFKIPRLSLRAHSLGIETTISPSAALIAD
jgi:hypothetical protein